MRTERLLPAVFVAIAAVLFAACGRVAQPQGWAAPVVADGTLYVTDATADAVRKYDATTGASQGTFVPTFSGGLDTPRGLLFAPDGSLLVASWANDSVKRYNGTTGAFLGTLVSTGSGGLVRPTDLELGPDGSLLVVSSSTKQILQYDLTTGAFRKVWAQGGSPVFLDSPSCVVRREQIGKAQ